MNALTRSSRTLAATAAAALVVGLTGAGHPAAAETRVAPEKQTPGLTTSTDKLDGARVASTPRALGRAGAAGSEPGDSTALPEGVPSKGRYAFLLALDTKATGTTYRSALGRGKTAAKAAARTQLAAVKAAQSSVVADLPARTPVLYRTHAVLAGVAVVTDVKNVEDLQSISGVSAVYPIAPKSPSNSSGVPLQGAPAGWTAHSNLGEDSTIAVIDTGIDYSHADFGGPGTVAAYDASKAVAGAPVGGVQFPNAKVIGGFDLAGDKYNADPSDPKTYQPVPTPDPYPLDCNGHGTHVAGTAAGLGVKSDGTTYTGAYNASTPFDSLRIGPGVAPGAKLYGYRVFGCEGSTNITSQAIDLAADPNQDGDTSDHADVVNLSLGSDYGSPQDADAVVTNNASKLGISMVVASGNAGDLYDVGGSPGSANRALTVAASQDAASQVDALNITAPSAAQYAAERSIAYDWANDADLSGNVVKLAQPGNADGCLDVTEPYKSQIAGKIAFVEWTDNDIERRCGSAARGAKLAAAGASGFIFGDDQENFAAGITGVDTIPGVLVAKSGADAIRAQLANGQTVTVGSTTKNGFKQVDNSLIDTLASFSSRGIGDAGNVKPDMTAVGASVFSAGNGTGNEGISESGTSMATPMTAGAAALVTTAHPDWTAEQVKAGLVNTSGADLYTEPNQGGATYAPQRVGAGRLQVDKALDNEVLAYVTDDEGSVSASFGPVAVDKPTTLTKTIRVQNTGGTAATYAVSFDQRSSVPGATYAVSPSSVAVDARSSKTVTVTLTVDPTKLTKTIDPTVDRVQGYPRQYQADTSGLVVLTRAGAPTLRVPVYAAPRPISSMTQAASVSMSGGQVQNGLLPLTGQPVNQGSGLTRIQSTVAGFELQATSGPAPACSTTVTSGCVGFPDERSADLKYVGTTSNAPQLTGNGEDPLKAGLAYFAISTQGPWRTAASAQEFDIYIDSTGDGKADVVTYNTRLTDTDVLVTETIDLATGDSLDLQLINDSFGDTDTAVFDSDTLVMPVAIGALPGVSSGTSRIGYAVQSFSPYQSDPIDQVGAVGDDLTLSKAPSMDVLKPGVALYGSYTGDASPLLFPDTPSSVLNLRRDPASYGQDKGLGALVVHFHNKVGEKAQVVKLRSASPVALALKPTTAARGQVVTGTVTVAEGAGGPATGAVALKSGSTTLASGTVANGTATLKFRVARAGSYRVTAVYAGDDGHEAATSTPVALTVRKSRATVAWRLTPNPVTHGRIVTASVRVPTQAGTVPTGRVYVKKSDGRTLTSGLLRNGAAQLRFRAPRKGTYALRVAYSGNINYLPAYSSTARLLVR